MIEINVKKKIIKLKIKNFEFDSNLLVLVMQPINYINMMCFDLEIAQNTD